MFCGPVTQQVAIRPRRGMEGMATVSSHCRVSLGTAVELLQVDCWMLNSACYALGTGWVKIFRQPLLFFPPSLSFLQNGNTYERAGVEFCLCPG